MFFLFPETSTYSTIQVFGLSISINVSGNKTNMECDGLLSTCIQHEINHLDGKLIIDFLSKLKKDILIKKLSKNKNTSSRVIV